jgi:hypothetical protein
MKASATPKTAPAPEAEPADTTAASPSDPTPPELQPPSTSESSLPEPTEEEFRAWDRRDPADEAKLAAWDRERRESMLRMYDELRCFHRTVITAGERRLKTSSDEGEWIAFRNDWPAITSEWLQRLLANERILERSRFASYFLEAHEILSHSYVMAYEARDQAAVEKLGKQWLAIEAKVRKHTTSLGGTLPPAPTRCDPLVKE